MPEAPKLCNPTPFDVEIPYERGIKIRVPADGSVNLNAGQYDSFRSGQPGSEGVKGILDMAGLFLLDSDLSYDFQALKCIEATIRARKERVNGFVQRLEIMASKDGGEADAKKIQHAKNTSGIARMEREIEKLEARRDTLRGHLGDTTVAKQRAALDPKRTCFVTNPPKEFPSVLALQLFLDENPSIKAEHEAKMIAMGFAEAPAAE